MNQPTDKEEKGTSSSSTFPTENVAVSSPCCLVDEEGPINQMMCDYQTLRRTIDADVKAGIEGCPFDP